MNKPLTSEVIALATSVAKELQTHPETVTADMLMALRGCAQVLEGGKATPES